MNIESFIVSHITVQHQSGSMMVHIGVPKKDSMFIYAGKPTELFNIIKSLLDFYTCWCAYSHKCMSHDIIPLSMATAGVHDQF